MGIWLRGPSIGPIRSSVRLDKPRSQRASGSTKVWVALGVVGLAVCIGVPPIGFAVLAIAMIVGSVWAINKFTAVKRKRNDKKKEKEYFAAHVPDSARGIR